MYRTIQIRAASRRLFAVGLVLMVILTGQTALPPAVSAGSRTVDVSGTVTEARIDSEGGCEKWTLLLWTAVPGAASYTIDMHDSWGYSFVATFPPYSYDEAFGGLPAVGAGQHRHALTYQGGGVNGCQGDDVARFTILSFVANFDNDDGRIVGTVTDRDGAGLGDVPISISGASGSTQRTNSAGAYGAIVTKGSYTVSAPAGYCVAGGTTCNRSKSLDVQGATSVNFVKSSGDGTISGLVTERTCTAESCTEAALPGVLVSAAGPAGGDQVTGDDGRYSITVGPGDYQVTPSLDAREFDPESLLVTVEAGDTRTADFATCADTPATLQASATTPTPTACKALHIDWTMPSHIRASGWNDAELSDTYVNPRGGWRVNLFLKNDQGTPQACAADRTWTWRLTPRGTDAAVTYANRSCTFSPKVPREGVYTVYVEERRKSDDHLMAKGTKDVVVQDFLIIGIGDSNGSGQSNPPYWNRQCDRSEQSYQMQAAEMVERVDPRTSVTFVHLACSGARTVHIASESYGGQEPSQGSLLPPQLAQLRRVLRVGHPVRELDAMILSAGINDLRFGGIIGACFENLRDVPCQDRFVKRVQDANGEPTLELSPISVGSDGRLRTVVNEEIAKLPLLFRKMANSMAKRVTIDPSRVLLTTYPDESWRAPGVLCDNTSGYRPRLTSAEWGWLSEAGGALNEQVANGPFTAVTTIPELFIGHGYCTGPKKNWFRSIFDSYLGQGNPYGTFHATKQGHFAMALEVSDVLCAQLFKGETNCQGMAREPGQGGLP